MTGNCSKPNLMKQIILTCWLAGLFLITGAQTYNNEWIDYSKTYYKFKVGKTGLYRISQASLATIGLANTPAEQFQLWRNGQQVPLYTSNESGSLSSNGFIEFWGEQNDGKADNELYKEPTFQLSDKYSLQTDTAAFFLTVNTAGNNLRLQQTVNNIAGNTLPAEPYFMFTEGKYFRDYINGGFYIDVGEYVYSSSYDRGESWVGYDIYPDKAYKNAHKLYVYTGGPDASFKINLSGNAYYPRRYSIKINNDSIWGSQLDYLNFEKAIVPSIPLTVLNADSARIQIKNLSDNQYDRLVVAQYELIYPRIFNFGGAKNFEFELPPNPSGNYLEISNFNYGSTSPVLYDLTNGKRYTGDVSNPALVKFALLPSTATRKLILISLDPSNISTVTNFVTRHFINYGAPDKQGDYLIITHPSLYNGPGGSNPVADYQAYRSGVAGGSFTAKIYEIDELVDQFAFGIKKHPASIRNFLRWARATYAVAPKYVLLMGHGLVYTQYRYNESNPDVEKLNLIPTFGIPASDNLLSAEPGGQIPVIPIGRLSAINGEEIADYLVKVKQYEQAQQTPSPYIKDKAWMKNMAHVIGGNNPSLVNQLSIFFDQYNRIISDTLFGANITMFKKSSAEEVEQLSSTKLASLFAEGISQITYFGHSSTTVLAFNLDDPKQYNNQGKYPIFVALGCLAGNFYTFNAARFLVKSTLSENFIFSKERGSIIFLASSHYGLPVYLDIYTSKLYTSEAQTLYGKPFGDVMKETIIQTFNQTSQNNFYARFHTEQNTLHGDPAIRLNGQSKPDYAIEDQLVKLSPTFISIAEPSFKAEAKFVNLGKAVHKDIAVEVKRQFPDGHSTTVLKDTIPGIRYQDSLTIWFPIDPKTDKGLNRITITLDADNVVDEVFETNNTVTKDVFIFEDDIRPVYPLNFAIVNNPNIKLQASTANSLSPAKQYRMEIDTTELFNSSLRRTQTLSSSGGVLEFVPGISFTDSTVYYWRVSPLDNQGNATKWNSASFVYLAGSEPGFNQSHFYQHSKSNWNRLQLDSASRTWKYNTIHNNLFIRTGVYPTASGGQSDFAISVNGQNLIGPGCNYNELIINVIDPVSFMPWRNNATGTLYNSSGLCGTQREYNFHFFLTDTLWRRRAQQFLENIVPSGAYVVIRSNTSPNHPDNVYAAAWKADTAYFGPGNSLYHTLRNQGFSQIDLYDTTRCFIFVYKKNDQNFFPPKMIFSQGIYDRLLMDVDCPTTDTLGYITSPVWGKAKQWKQLTWKGSSSETIPGDAPSVDVIGVEDNGSETTLLTGLSVAQQVYDLSAINAAQYPYLKLRMRNADSVNSTPYQLKYWRITYVPVPEGALAPNLLFQMKDTFELGEPIDFKVAFKNVSDARFDSLKVKLILTNASNAASSIPLSRFKPLVSGDTLHVRYPFSSQGLVGYNNLFLDVNPDQDQPEQFHFNNFLYKNFYVKEDKLNPLLDVTFDGVHILNNDIVSSKPHIVIKLKDESKWSVLNDTSGIKVQVRYPDGFLRPFYFINSDTLKFTPAPGLPSNDNTATVDFMPAFLKDGDYELVVTGKDRSGNIAGSVEYKVGFQVINKPMISNMLNYPNPFTTSTAFVFTITGSELPQHIKIQILTITGKVVREITKDELGPLHIGRNITEFKWDGTDQYGQKLANGIYLYRVITNLNGRALDQYKAQGDKTDQYFNKGYGKMYLMR